MVEPVTAAWFVVTALTYEDKADLRIVSPQSNAGAYKTINVTTNVAADLPQWSNVSYYNDKIGDSISTSGDTDIGKVYVSNDANNLYVRIKNTSGHLSGYNTTPRFAMTVYAEDFKHSTAESLSTGIYGGSLDRSMQYMVSRWSDSSNFAKFHVSNSSWTFEEHLTSITIPQWDVNTGDIEMVIPLSELSSTGTVTTGDWADLNIVLTRQDPVTLTWHEDDIIAIHYRITTSGEQWFYGNVE